MSQLELSIKYPLLSKTDLTVCAWLWAVFGLIAVYCISRASALFGIETNTGLELLLSLMFAAIYAYVPFNVYIKQSQGSNLIVNKDGLGVPSRIFSTSHWLAWSHLKSVGVTNHQCRVVLKFEPGGEVDIEKTRMSESELQQVLLAVEVWGIHAQWMQSALDLRDQLLNKTQGLEKGSYTEIWEEELGRRFNSTTFIPLEPGRCLRSGSLTVIKQIAFGGFSAIYLAKDEDGDEVVLKESVASAEGPNDAVHQKAIEMFGREARLLSGLKHDQIARVLDDFVELGRSYLVLEYIPGENLRQFVKRNGKQPESKVLGWMAQMAEMLSYLHSQSPPLVHRDFTPDNLVLKNDGSLVLIDFGAANQFLSTATGTLVGKQCYMPPEQVRGKAEPRSDLYALGCTAHFLLTGKDPLALSECHPRQIETSVSDYADGLIANLTKLDLASRLMSASELVAILADPDDAGQIISTASVQREKIG